MKHSKHLLLSIFCLTVLASCANNKPIKQPEIVPEPITTNVEVIENDAEVQMIEEIAVDQLQETSLEEIPSIKYSTYEGDMSIGTDEKILFFYSADDTESIQIDENFSAETELATFSDIFKIDMESNIALTQQYNITEANTFILIDEDGNMITRTNGASGSQDLLKLYD